jgi:hypothetical protein
LVETVDDILEEDRRSWGQSGAAVKLKRGNCQNSSAAVQKFSQYCKSVPYGSAM